MKIGTAEILDEPEEKKRKRASITSGFGSGNSGGNNRNGGGGGSDGPNDDDQVDDRDTFTERKSKILAWFVMLVVVMTFGGLLAAYVVISTNKLQEWRPFDLPYQLWISTLLIMASSISFYYGDKYMVAGDHRRSKLWLLITGAIGILFVCSQVIAWMVLSATGHFMEGNPYVGFFYMLTAVHAAHVLGGLVALGVLLKRSWAPPTDDLAQLRRTILSQVVGWYWHFMAILWVILFFFLGYWK